LKPLKLWIFGSPLKFLFTYGYFEKASELIRVFVF